MKRALLYLLVVAVAYGLAQIGGSDITSIRNETQKLLRARVDASPDQPFDLTQLDNLHSAIAGNRANVWKLAPDALIPLQETIEPLRDIAKQLALSPRPDEHYYGAVLNSWLKPTGETRSLLVRLAHDDQAGTAATALDALFGLKLETPELRREVVQALQEDGPPREHTTLHSVSRTRVGTWGVEEAVPVLMKLLEDSLAKGGPVDDPAVKQLKALGRSAEKALPLLREALAQRRVAGDADFRELEALEHAVLVVSGEYKVPGTSLTNPASRVAPSGVERDIPPVRNSASPRNAKPDVSPPNGFASVPGFAWVGLIVTAAGILLMILKKKRS